MNSSTQVDIVVVGGGPAGTATAMRLARDGRAAVVVERSGYQRHRMGETLPPIVNRELAELGLFDVFLAMDPLPSHETASAWGHGAVAARSFVFDPFGHGWHVDRARFDEMLADAAEAAGATVVRRAHVRGVARSGGGGLTVTIEGRAGLFELRAAQVVDASGRSAQVARSLGAVGRRLDRLVAVSVVCQLEAGAAVGDTFVEAVAEGWWYVSPLPGHRRMISMFTEAAIARSQRLAEPSGWWEALSRTEHIVSLARQGGPTSRPTIVSAASRVLEPAAGDCWIAVGDAALAVDPLSSSGVSTAFASAGRAIEVLTAPADVRACAAGDYARWVASKAERLVDDRARYYGLEDRFTDLPFWRARRTVPAPVPGTAAAATNSR